jgi:hypothetical protein
MEMSEAVFRDGKMCAVQAVCGTLGRLIRAECNDAIVVLSGRFTSRGRVEGVLLDTGTVGCRKCPVQPVSAISG